MVAGKNAAVGPLHTIDPLAFFGYDLHAATRFFQDKHDVGKQYAPDLAHPSSHPLGDPHRSLQQNRKTGSSKRASVERNRLGSKRFLH
jgi:hypothetical protein